MMNVSTKKENIADITKVKKKRLWLVFKNIFRIFLLHEKADKCVKYLTAKLKNGK